MITLKEFKDLMPSLFFVLFLVFLFLNLLMSWRNDIRRHKEVTAFIELFQKHNKELILAYGNVLAEVTNARYLLIEKDTDGSLTVRMLGSSDRDKIAKELERQRAKTSD